MGDEYNGWTNYETWCVNLWLTNEEGDYKHWRARARRLDKADLAAELKEEVSAGCDEIELPGMMRDLLNASLSEVDWYEVAAAFIDEVKEG